MSDTQSAPRRQAGRDTYDVIVVGAGFAGLAAALEASLAGASVLIIEKMRTAGGNSIVSDGGFAAPRTGFQQRAGIEDSPELMYADMMKAGLGLNDPELVRTVAENALDAFNWTVEYLGVKYMDRVDLFGGHSVARSHAAARISGASIVNPMLKKVRERDIPVLTSCTLRRLMFTEGVVSGVEVLCAGNEDGGAPTAAANAAGEVADAEATRTIHARTGVVLAAGGFGADVAFRSAQDPRLSAEIDTTNRRSATAEVLVEALRLGAMPVQLCQIQLGPWTSPDEKGFGVGPLFADYIAFIHGIVVHPDTGRRFVDERSDRKTLSDALLEVGKPSVCISDHAAVDRSGWDLSMAIKKKIVRTFPSLEALSIFYGIPGAGLETTVANLAEDVDRPDPPHLDTPPYYAMRVWPKVHYTMGGVRIDRHARVMGLDHRPIPGLFAAGEVTGGVHGACRLGSCAIPDCIVFGRIAGRQAAGRARGPCPDQRRRT